MIEINWIDKAKQHFNDYGGKPYTSGDNISKESQKINVELQLLLEKQLNNDKDILLNKQGSKWSVQGQNKLADGIWYRAYYKTFGANYPIVFGVYLGKSGLNIAIQIYNNSLGDLSLSKKLGGIIADIFEQSKKLGQYQDIEFRKRDNEDEKYSDYGFFNLDTFEEEKFKKILAIYKEIVLKVNKSIFANMLKLYVIAPSSKHCQISETDSHYTQRKGVKKMIDEFIEDANTPTEEQFRAFWNRQTINSAQQASNATNIINRNESIENLQKKIKSLVDLSKETTNMLVEEIQNQIESSKKSSLELYYYYHMEEDKFPLINGGIENALSIIEKNCIELTGIDIVEKMDNLKKNMIEHKLEQFYLLDQFLNLLDKIKYEDIANEKNEINKELYQLAYLFTFFRKSKVVNNANFFDELLQKSKNIILYGAPGTGKTYTSEMNIARIIEEDYPNEEINLKDRFQKIQFHPSYSYEDFMEGLKPTVSENGNVVLKLQEGDFVRFCKKAKEFEEAFKTVQKDKMRYAFFFLVDEINRAELSRVFGEVMYALDKRGNTIQTQYSYLKSDEHKYFSIPENVYFIGTMNDVDRSIDSFDIALRRRFFWYRMDCDYFAIQDELLQFTNIGTFDAKDIPTNGYLKACYDLNQYITTTGKTTKEYTTLGLGNLYQLGHDYFMKIKQYAKSQTIKNGDLKDLFEFSIEPLLKEYLRSEYSEDEIETNIKKAKDVFIIK